MSSTRRARLHDEVAGPVRFAVLVEVAAHEGIADPAGSTIERALPALGFEGVSDVRVGKAIRFTLDAPDEADARVRVADMCARFLTNPVIERSIVTMEGQP
jgi:phosphoribosylformylglycinamidine synthase